MRIRLEIAYKEFCKAMHVGHAIYSNPENRGSIH